MIKNIIFDIGSVLVAFDYHKYFTNKYHDEAKEKAILQESLFNPLWEKFDLGLQEESVILDEIVNKYPEHKKEILDFYDSIPNMVYEYTYSAPLIKKLKSHGYNVYLLSNFGKVHFNMLVKKMHFINLVDGMVISYLVHMVKPNKDIYEHLLSLYNLDGSESVFIDDRLTNVIAGNELFLKSIQFFSLNDLEEKLSSLGVDL